MDRSVSPEASPERPRTDLASERWPAPSSRVRRSFRSLGHRNYRLFFSGQLISLIGTWMQSVAQAWLVFRLTNSPIWLGLIGFAGQIPVFLLAPVGGSFADAGNRHRILLATQTSAMLLAFALAALTLSHTVTIPAIFLLASLLGVVNAFDIPARQAFLTDMVGKADLINAVALTSSMVNGARIVGPAVAGIVVSLVGEGWCFALNGVSYLAVISGLLAMQLPPRAKPAPGGSPLAHVAEGFRFAARTAPIRVLLVLLGLISLMGMPYAVLMPIFAVRILHGGPRGLGLLMGSSGLGALAGALVLTTRSGVRGLGRWVAWAAAGFGVSLIAFSSSRTFWLSCALLVPVGFSMIVQMASSNTLIQAMTPDHLRGRVMALYSMMFMGMAPVGALLAGTAARYLGAPATVACGGLFCIAGAAVFALRLPLVRAEGRQLVIAQEAAGGDPPDEQTGVPLPADAVEPEPRATA